MLIVFEIISQFILYYYLKKDLFLLRLLNSINFIKIGLLILFRILLQLYYFINYISMTEH